MHQAEPYQTPPRSVLELDGYAKPPSAVNGNGRQTPQAYSPAQRSKASDTLINPGFGLFSPHSLVKTNGHIELDNEDADSNVQEGMRSELGEPIVSSLNRFALAAKILTYL